MVEETPTKADEYNDIVEKYLWLVRPCEDYKAELKECQSFKGRFHQYFIYGEFLDCSDWSQNLKNCPLCLEKKNKEACKIIIRNETQRRIKRFSGAKQNDVWKKRDKPPSNWNGPLPEFFIERNKNYKSVLSEKVEEFNEYILRNEPNKKYSCTIL